MISARFSASVRDHSAEGAVRGLHGELDRVDAPGGDRLVDVLRRRVDHLELVVAVASVCSPPISIFTIASPLSRSAAPGSGAAAHGSPPRPSRPRPRRAVDLLLHHGRDAGGDDAGGISCPSRTTLPAATSAPAPTRARCRTIAPIAISAPSSTTQPSSSAPWPTVTLRTDDRRQPVGGVDHGVVLDARRLPRRRSGRSRRAARRRTRRSTRASSATSPISVARRRDEGVVCDARLLALEGVETHQRASRSSRTPPSRLDQSPLPNPLEGAVADEADPLLGHEARPELAEPLDLARPAPRRTSRVARVGARRQPALQAAPRLPRQLP